MHHWQAPVYDGVREHTSDAANRRIDRTTRGTLDELLDSPERIRARLAELDREWTVDRALMLNFAILGGISSALTVRNLRRSGRIAGWGALLFTQLGFLGYHAVRRWCPPLPVFRRLGFRTDKEIAAERAVLNARLAAMEQPPV